MATSVLLVVVAIASIAGRIVGNESQTTIIRESGGYSADDAPQAAATFPDNDLILIGTVLRIEPARWSDGDHDHGHIFTPVVLSVEEVLRGSYGFDSITVQSLGGTVNGVGMLFTDAVSLADAPVGATLILFLTERAPGRDLPRAPNMAYAVDEGLATSLSAEQHRIEVEDFKELIRQARPSGGA